MQKRHFEHMASIVKAILDGHWIAEFPPYGDESRNAISWNNSDYAYTRAVWTAEAFIKIAAEHNPRFDQDRFLVACGLVAKPAKKGKAK
jgi:hypothetical protein